MLPNDSHPHLETVSRASLSNSSTLWRVYSTEWIFCFQSFSVCQLTRKVCLSLSLKSCQDFLQIPVNLGTTLTPLLCSLFTLLFHCLTPWYSGEAESPQSIMFCCTWAFLLQSLFFFFFGEITGKDICVGRLFMKSIYLSFFWTGPFSLHLLWLSEETLWITAQLLPQLNGLFTSTAPRMLPKTTAPLCGYSRGLHAPNSGCKSSLKKAFSSSEKRGLSLAYVFGITQSSPQATLH